MCFVKFLFKLCLGLCIFFCIFYFVFLSESKKNLKNDPLIKQWVGKEFKIKKGVYIFRYDGDKTDRYHLELPPKNADFPPSLECFIKDPTVWFDFSQSWYRPIMPERHFRILKIFKHTKPLVGEFLTIEALMLDGDYKKCIVEMNALFDYDLWTFQIFGPKEEFIQQLN